MNRALRICKIASLYDHPWKGGAERQLALQVADELMHHSGVTESRLAVVPIRRHCR